MQRTTWMGTGLVLGAILITGCENTREGVERDAELAAQQADQAAKRSAEAAREAARDVSEAADEAAAATREAAQDTGQTVREGAASAAGIADAAQQTAQIKSALMADTSIDSSGIDVDTESTTRTVTLKGRVRTDAEKARAARIAADKAPGYRVTNNLQVGR